MGITRRIAAAAIGGMVLAGSLTTGALAGNTATYRVTLINLVSGQPWTPPVIAIHGRDADIWSRGEAASTGVQAIAENGDLGPLLAALPSAPGVVAFQAADAPVVADGVPGAATFDGRVTFTITADRSARFLSSVAMLICTNDGFTGVDHLRLPRAVGGRQVAVTAAYDAGTEMNTEDFADIVPPCQGLVGVTSADPGTGTTDPSLAQGDVIRRHGGIDGGEDLVPGIHGWTSPVGVIIVKRIA